MNPFECNNAVRGDDDWTEGPCGCNPEILQQHILKLQAALQSIAAQTKCHCYHSDTGNKYECHSADCNWYIREEALEALEVKK